MRKTFRRSAEPTGFIRSQRHATQLLASGMHNVPNFKDNIYSMPLYIPDHRKMSVTC